MNVNPATLDRLGRILGRVVRLIALVLALTLAARGWAYIGPAAPDRTPDALDGLNALLPMPAWAIVCFAISATIISGILFHRLFYSIGLTAYCALNGAWVMSYLSAWAFGYSDRSWITAVGYMPEIAFAVALLILGPPRPLARKLE